MERNCYELFGYRFALTTKRLPGDMPVGLLYPALRSASGPCDAEWTVRQVIRAGGPVYMLGNQQGVVHETDDPVRLIEQLEWTIMLSLLAAHDHFLQLHAAGLVKDDRGLLLVGPSGSGKSTQALGLLQDGWRCLSDEIILLEPGGSRAWPFPRSFHTTAATLRLFPELHRPDSAVFVDSSGKSRFDPSVVRKDWVARPARPAWLVFPVDNPAGGDELTPLGETEALSMLIEQAINLSSFGDKGIEVLVRLVRSCECYRLDTRDVKRAGALFSELAGSYSGEEAHACA